MENTYLQAAQQGKNEVWRYVVVILAVMTVIFSVQIIAIIPFFLIEGTTDLNQLSPLSLLLLTMLPFPFAGLTILAGVAFLHRRPLKSIFRPVGAFQWRRMLLSGAVWFGLSAAADLVLAQLQPGNYVWNFNLLEFLPYFVLAVLLIPLQTSTEELLFRGYLTQWLGRYSKGLWLPLIAPSLFFMLLHGANPEVGTYGLWFTMPFYLGIGLLLGWVTLRSEGLELALGLHAANNLYAALVVTFPSSAIPSPALFRIQNYDAAAGLIVFAVMAVIYLLIINGCTLTKGAERDIRRYVRHCREARPDAKVILAGCHAQVYRESTFGADLVLGHQEKFQIASLFEETGCFVAGGRNFQMEQWRLRGTGNGRTRFFFKIQDGCDHFCSYCIVPFARGKGRSQPARAILEGMAFLKDKGVKEAVLTGIDIASYRDASSGVDLGGLLQRLEHAETPPRIRISSVDPMALQESLLDVIAASGKVAPSLHIPLQSGCDAVLKAMGRPYSCSQVRTVVERIVRRMPHVGIGMDVMVGFPGEGEEAFDETLRFVESLPVYYLHVFPYSDRHGTRASALGPKVPEPVKKERVRRMKELDTAKRIEFYRRFVGQRLSIIPEGKKGRDGMMKGYSENYIPVYLPYEKSLENNIVEVTIRGLKNNLPLGER